MKKLFFSILLGWLSIAWLSGQDVTFSFANAQITNSGNCYEVDVMIQSTAGFKLGSGQLYFNYNTAAFGTNVVANSKLTITRPSGSILETQVGSPPFQFDFYNNFVENDNTSSRFSFSWQHAFSEACLSGNNITNSATALFHIKLDFATGGSGQSPNLCFENSGAFDDQTFTACGPATCTNVNCTSDPGTQITNDNFDCSGAVLPVELLFFITSLNEKNNVVLNWETASEFNTSHFEIERSKDGFHWEYLNSVAAHGEASKTMKYEFIDRNVSFDGFQKIVYYRLKMVDRDEIFEYSEIRNIWFSQKYLAIQVYPNPTIDDLFISFSENLTFSEGAIEFLDLKGNTLFQTSFWEDSHPIHIPLNEYLPSGGIYLLSVKLDGKNIFQERIIVMNR